jgi:hypothetical protein
MFAQQQNKEMLAGIPLLLQQLRPVGAELVLLKT